MLKRSMANHSSKRKPSIHPAHSIVVALCEKPIKLIHGLLVQNVHVGLARFKFVKFNRTGPKWTSY